METALKKAQERLKVAAEKLMQIKADMEEQEKLEIDKKYRWIKRQG